MSTEPCRANLHGAPGCGGRHDIRRLSELTLPDRPAQALLLAEGG